MCDRKPAGNMLWAVLLTLTVATGITACLDSSSTAPHSDPGTLTITTGSPLSNGFVGIPYSLQLATSGGKPAYTWSLVAGSPALPNGLNLSPAGLISGIPTTQQSVTPKFSVQDSSLPAPQVVGKQLSLTILQVPQPTITTPSPLPNGIVNHVYPSTTLTAVGGTSPYTWSAVVSPALPAGLTFNAATHTISGTPTATESNVTHMFSVTDSFVPTPQTVSKGLALTVSVAPLTLGITTDSPLLGGTVTQTYGPVQLAASGGTPPLTWDLAPGSPALPNGLQLSSGGVLSGTPSTAVNVTSVFRVRDAATSPQQTATKPLAISISLPTALNISTPSLSNGVLNQAYSQTVQATGGSGTRNWSFLGGNIPNLIIGHLTGAITGNPSPTGQFTFTVQVTDALFTDTKDFTITITAPPAPQITTSSLPTGTVNVPYPSTTLTATGGAPPLNFQPIGLPFGLSFNVTPNSSTATITGTPTSNGSQNVTFTVNDSTVPFNQTGTKTLSLAINAALTIGTTSPLSPSGTVGDTYGPLQLIASGGTPPYSWSITGPGAPATAAPGLTLSSDGVISGTPSTAGSFARTYRVQDDNGGVVTKSLALNVNAALTIDTDNTTLPLPAGMELQSYSGTLAASGGTQPYTWSVDPLTPLSLSLNSSTGEITGAPDSGTAGTTSHNFTVQDSASHSASKFLDLTISP